MIASSSGCTPLFLNEEPHRTGVNWRLREALRIAALMRAGVPYLLSIAVAGATMIAASWLVAIEAEPRIRLLLDHTVFRYRLKAA